MIMHDRLGGKRPVSPKTIALLVVAFTQRIHLAKCKKTLSTARCAALFVPHASLTYTRIGLTIASNMWSIIEHYRNGLRKTGPLWGDPPPVDSPHKGPVVWSFDGFFVVNLYKLLNKQSRRRQFKMPWHSCDVTLVKCSCRIHYSDVTMSGIASQIMTNLTIVYSTVYSDADKENIKVPRHWPLCGEFTGDRGIPAQMASNTENVSIWWRHHVFAHLQGTGIWPSLITVCRCLSIHPAGSPKSAVQQTTQLNTFP